MNAEQYFLLFALALIVAAAVPLWAAAQIRIQQERDK
jgi:hypothetical protein